MPAIYDTKIMKSIERLLEGNSTSLDSISVDITLGKIIDAEGAVSEYAIVPNMDPHDAKLSASKRKNLSSSTFCGPNRSFPVPDCAHVTAARRLIGRYKGPGNKSAILACINRKAKSLGCDKGKDSIDDRDFLDRIEALVRKNTDILYDDNGELNLDNFLDTIMPEIHLALADYNKIKEIQLDDIGPTIELSVSTLAEDSSKPEKTLPEAMPYIVYSAILECVKIGDDRDNDEDINEGREEE